MVAILLGAGPTAALTSDGADGDRSDLSDDIRFRTSHEFRSDIAFVRAAAADPVGFPHNEFGIPLSRDEAREVHRRYQDPQPWYGWYSPIDVGAAQFNSNWGYTYSLCTTASC